MVSYRLDHKFERKTHKSIEIVFLSQEFWGNVYTQECVETEQDRKLSDARRDTWAHTSLGATVGQSWQSTSSND